MSNNISRRSFVGLAAVSALSLAGLGGCANSTASNSVSSGSSTVRTIVDQAGETIEINGPVESYAVLTTGQMNICALLDKNLEHLVGAAAGGVTLNATYHHFFPELENHAKYYDKGNVTAEELLETGCQIMFWSSSKHEDLIKSLKDAGVICINVKKDDLESLKQVISLTADVLDTEYAHSQADKFIGYLDETVETTMATVPAGGLGKTATILGSPEGMEVRPADDYASKWLEGFGLTYLAGDSEREGSAALTLEELYEWDPDYVIFEFGSDLNELTSDPAWAELRALKEGHCYNCPMCLDEWLMPGIENAPLYEWGAHHFLGSLSEEDFKLSMKQFYHDFVAIDMADEDVDAIASGDAAYYL